MLVKTKCNSRINCESCHTKGMLQLFLDKESKPKYGRIRPSQKIDSKIQFSYHPQSLAYISSKISILKLNNDDLGQKNDSKGQLNSSSISRLEPRAGFGPATINSPRNKTHYHSTLLIP